MIQPAPEGHSSNSPSQKRTWQKLIDSESVESTFALADLLHRAKHGDPDAEFDLFYRYSSRLVRLAASRMNEIFNAKIDPEDIVQSVFRSFFVAHRSGEKQQHFESWSDLWSFLTVITVRKCNYQVKWYMRHKRNVFRETSIPQATSDYESANELSKLHSPEPFPFQVAAFNEILEQLTDSLDDLQKEIFRFRLLGYSSAEIAEKVKRTERTVHRTMSGIRKRLKSLLRETD